MCVVQLSLIIVTEPDSQLKELRPMLEEGETTITFSCVLLFYVVGSLWYLVTVVVLQVRLVWLPSSFFNSSRCLLRVVW